MHFICVSTRKVHVFNIQGEKCFRISILQIITIYLFTIHLSHTITGFD